MMLTLSSTLRQVRARVANSNGDLSVPSPALTGWVRVLQSAGTGLY